MEIGEPFLERLSELQQQRECLRGKQERHEKGNGVKLEEKKTLKRWESEQGIRGRQANVVV